MKIAISGAHCTGKTTLVEEMSQSLSDYTALEEPYYSLAAAGYEFCGFPSLEDYEQQLEYSIDQILASEPDSIFDRCPLDFLAYINVHKDSSSFDLDNWSIKVQETMGQIDLLIITPIENPDLIMCPDSEYPELRQKVNEELQDLAYDYKSSSTFKVLEVNGTIESRLNQIVSFIKSG
jgi:hypothetical protein